MPPKLPINPMSDPISDPPDERRWTSLIHNEAAGGLALALAALAAMFLANSPWHSSYASFWRFPVNVAGLNGSVTDLRGWVDQGLMTLFFLVVGEELGREWREGDFKHMRNALFPLIGALGGMVGAATIYLATTIGTDQAKGWGVPMATDIAFTLGALALLGRAVPSGLRMFLLALAIADDMGSIIMLAAFYPAHIDAIPLIAAFVLIAATALMRRWVSVTAPYLLAGAALWFLLARAGIEAALAGAAVGFLMPAGKRSDRLWSGLHFTSSFAVLPIFGLANAGFAIQAGLLSSRNGAAGVFAGIAAARVAGKLGGILLFCWLAVRLHAAHRPTGVSWLQIAGGSAIAGVGFTVPLLFARAAFAGHPVALNASKAGLYVGSLAAFLTGAAILLLAAKMRNQRSQVFEPNRGASRSRHPRVPSRGLPFTQCK